MWDVREHVGEMVGVGPLLALLMVSSSSLVNAVMLCGRTLLSL